MLFRSRAVYPPLRARSGSDGGCRQTPITTSLPLGARRTMRSCVADSPIRHATRHNSRPGGKGFGRELSRTDFRRAGKNAKSEIRNKHESRNTNPKSPSGEFSSPVRVIGSFEFRVYFEFRASDFVLCQFTRCANRLTHFTCSPTGRSPRPPHVRR